VSIRARLLTLMLFATLIPAMVAGLQFFERRNSEIAAARRELAATAQGLAQGLHDTVRATAQLHYGLSRARDLQTEDKAACSNFLAEVLKRHPQYTGILTIKPDGQLFCDSLRTGRKLDLADRRYFQDALDAEKSLGVEPVFGRLTGRGVLQVAYAARRDNGEPLFVLLASLDLQKHMQLRAHSLLRGSAVIGLVDGKGTILTWYPDGPKRVGTSVAGSPLDHFARQSQVEPTVEDVEFGGVSRIWAVSALPEFAETGLRVLVGVSKADLLAAANRNLHQALATLAIVLLLVFTGAWVLVELVLRRQAGRIITAVERFSGGNFATRIGEPYPRGEIGHLMGAMDQAFGVMHAQQDTIHGLNTNLERRVAERTAQLEAANKELEAFSYSVSHDLRAPLRSIDGFSQALLEDYADKLDGEGKDYLKRVRAATQRMGKLIEDILNLSRVTRTEIHLETVDLSAMAQAIIAELQRSQPESHPEFVAAEGIVAEGDGGLLKVALENLLGNAWKFSGKRAQAKIEFGTTRHDGNPAYFVRDNGAGFDMTYASKLFGVFQRLHDMTEFKGTGIGLATVQRIIHRHGGRVWAEGKVEEGATFYFTLSQPG